MLHGRDPDGEDIFVGQPLLAGEDLFGLTRFKPDLERADRSADPDAAAGRVHRQGTDIDIWSNLESLGIERVRHVGAGDTRQNARQIAR